MAKPLVFDWEGAPVAFEMNKVDRSKLYGTKEVELLDEYGKRCELATLADDGHTIIGRGGTGIGTLSADGLWCDKSELQPVDLSGQPIEPVPSSFAAPIALGQPTSADDYLQHSIRGVYAMTLEGDATNESAANAERSTASLLGQLRAGSIFKFSYSYRGGLEADVAFLLANDAGDVFMAVGSATAIDFVGLEQVAATVDDDTLDDEADGDDIDFSMI